MGVYQSGENHVSMGFDLDIGSRLDLPDLPYDSTLDEHVTSDNVSARVLGYDPSVPYDYAHPTSLNATPDNIIWQANSLNPLRNIRE
jgi:hypothetical protein